MLKFALNINSDTNPLSPTDGLAFGELGVLINHLDKATNPKDGVKCTLSGIENHGYTPHFNTESNILYNNFIELHKKIQERELHELRKEEATYVNTLKNILSADKYVEPLDNDWKPLYRLTGKQIVRGIETYYAITNSSGILSEIGSPKLDETRHIYLHDTDYKIFITPQQEDRLKDYYRKGILNLKLKQKRSVKTGRIVSAQLISFSLKPGLTISESLSSLTEEERSSIGEMEGGEDILTLLRS